MKSLAFFVSALVAVSATIHYMDWKGYEDGHRYFYFAADDGKPYLVDSMEPVDQDAISNYTCCPANNGYWLYTRSNPIDKQDLIMGDESSVQQSYFNPRKMTVFISHGWIGDGDIEMNVHLTKVLLDSGDINVIVLDWSKLSKKGYVTARLAVPKVGRMLGKFINWLHEAFGMCLSNIHIIGHSLGGHVVGNAGKELEGRAQRITALDPAGPLWYSDEKNRVAKTDAQYVEIIHTNGFGCGYPFPSGHSDHYPNGGQLMPGCFVWDIVCHHMRSWRYLASSIENDRFSANECNDLHEAWSRLRQCTGEIGNMGNNLLHKHQLGLYKINTKAHYPYI